MREVDTWTGADARLLRRIGLRLSLREFAEMTGISDRTLSKWEQGDGSRRPRSHYQAVLDTRSSNGPPRPSASAS
jgi:DNA-binding transcriptional regulator YiaG